MEPLQRAWRERSGTDECQPRGEDDDACDDPDPLPRLHEVIIPSLHAATVWRPRYARATGRPALSTDRSGCSPSAIIRTSPPRSIGLRASASRHSFAVTMPFLKRISFLSTSVLASPRSISEKSSCVRRRGAPEARRGALPSSLKSASC